MPNSILETVIALIKKLQELTQEQREAWKNLEDTAKTTILTLLRVPEWQLIEQRSLSPERPPTPEEVYIDKKKLADFVEAGCREIKDRAGWTGGLSGLTGLPSVSGWISSELGMPSTAARVQNAIEVYRSVFRYGQDPLLQRYWQKIYQPFLPGYADIISIYMKEGYLEEKWVEIPEEFVAYMGEQGYSREWALRIWGRHWVLPGVDHLYDMFHKGIIDYDTMAKMLKYHDFEPVWRDRLIANAYNMIPRVDLRRAFRYGLIEAEGLTARYEKLGYAEGDAVILGQMAVRASLDRYYTRLETVARAAYRKGRLAEPVFRLLLRYVNTPAEAIDLCVLAENIARAGEVLEPGEQPRTLTASQTLNLYQERLLTREIALTRLTGLGYTPQDAELLLSLSEPRPAPAPPKTIEQRRAELLAGPRILTPAQILTAYRERLITQEAASARLRGMGYTSEDISFLLALSEPRPEPMEVNRELISAASTLYREGFMTAEEFRGYLRKAGLSESDISRKVDAEELRYRYDYLKDLTALAREAYKKDVYTLEELEGYLLGYGMQHDRAMAIAALEELRKTPKPKRAS